jgi:hypothetical protein
MSRDITPFGIRMPTDLKSLVDAAATDNKRSINAEVVARIQKSFEPQSDLKSVAAGVLIEELINRLGAHVQIVVSKDAAKAAGIASGDTNKPVRRAAKK